MSDIAYLQAANVVKLQSAARMAGLRWKSGAPGYDKQGIIDKLSQHPSIMRATIATLQRMESGDLTRDAQKPSSFLEDIAEETKAPPQAEPVHTPLIVNPANPEALNAATRAIHGLSQRVERLESYAINKGDAATISLQCFEQGIKPIRQSLDALAEAVIVLQKQRPIEFHFPNVKPITVNPAECHASYPKLLQYLQINRRVILVGSAGTGKSMAVKNAAEALGVPFYLVPPVTMSHELIGHRDAQGVFHETPLTLAYKNGGLCLLDEADASLPDALLCANPILDGNGFATLGDGVLHKQHPDFFAVFNMNTDGNGATMQYSGRNRLDGATIARFGVRIQWDIDARIESGMAQGQTAWHKVITDIRAFMLSRDIVDVNATPRHLKTGAALLNAKLPRADVLADCLKSGALAASWDDVLRIPSVRSFLQGV